MPRVSVLMPVRDAAGSLGRAIASVVAQDFRDWELWVVDDGSHDGSVDVAERWRERDSRVRLEVLGRRAGIVAALRTGCGLADCELVARMDADDWSDPRRFGRQCEMLGRDPSLAAVACRVRLAGALGDGMRRYVDWTNSLATPEDIARERFIESPVVHPSVMMRRAALEEAGGYQEVEGPEDHDLWLRMLGRGMRIGRVAEVGLEWCDRPERLTRTDDRYATERVWRMKARHLARLPALRERGAVICGAGPLGKRLRRDLAAFGAVVHGFFEVHPGRIGQRIHGLPVWGAGEAGNCGARAVWLSAVGVAGGRERVRDLAHEAGRREGEDFWCCC